MHSVIISMSVFMRTASLVLLAVLGSAMPMATQSKDAVPSAAPTRISRAEIAEDGSVRIRFSNGRSVQVRPEKGQAGREQLQVATSGSAVGWLEVDVPVGSYSVPTTLTVYQVDKPLTSAMAYCWSIGNSLIATHTSDFRQRRRTGQERTGSRSKSTISRQADC